MEREKVPGKDGSLVEVIQQPSGQCCSAADIRDPVFVWTPAAAEHAADTAELEGAQAARQGLVEAPTLSAPKKHLFNPRVEPREAGGQRSAPSDQKVPLAVPGTVPCQEAVLEAGLGGAAAIQGNSEDNAF